MSEQETAGWIPSLRCPDPAIQILDPSFARYRLGSVTIERLATGMRWCEGPIWFGDGRYLLWSDIPNDRMMRWDEETGVVSVFRRPSHNANGNARDSHGRLVTCEHLTRRVTRTEYDGRMTVVCDSFDGKRLNSPNDLVVKSDGSIWFSDPTFGIDGYYEGNRDISELTPAVYRIDAADGAVTRVAEGIAAPNGLCFSPDETVLYVVESRMVPRRILAFDVAGGGKNLASGRVFVECDGSPDGIRCDIDGNLWCGWGGAAVLDGVRIFSSIGVPIGHISLPERCVNLCFGGRHRNRLFMAAAHSIYSLYVNTQGVRNFE